jgi:mono/diheme cytochrome c family protein
MKTLLKWIVGLALLLVVVGIGLAIAANLLFDRKRDRVIKLDVKGVTVASDDATLARGKYLFASRGCGDCHAANGAGRVFIDDQAGGFRVRSPNITPGGVTAKYTEIDWVRAIRHGVRPDGRALFVMPSEDYNRLTDADVAAIIVYARSLAPVSGGGAEFSVPLPVKALYAAGVVKDAADAHRRGRNARARTLRGKSLPRLPWRRSVRRQDPGRSARLAGRVEPDTRGGHGPDGLRQRRQAEGDVPQWQAPRRQCHRGDAVRYAARI